MKFFNAFIFTKLIYLLPIGVILPLLKIELAIRSSNSQPSNNRSKYPHSQKKYNYLLLFLTLNRYFYHLKIVRYPGHIIDDKYRRVNRLKYQSK